MGGEWFNDLVRAYLAARILNKLFTGPPLAMLASTRATMFRVLRRKTFGDFAALCREPLRPQKLVAAFGRKPPYLFMAPADTVPAVQALAVAGKSSKTAPRNP